MRDFDSTGQIIRFSPSSAPPEATPINHFLLTFHRYDAGNYWSKQWPVDSGKGGVLLWHATRDGVGLYDASYYSDRNFLPITVQAAHGEFVWSGTVNTGVEDPLQGLDSILIRTLGSDGKPSWWPYKNSSLGMGSRSIFYTPDGARDLAFYSNPNTNLYSSIVGENHSRNVTSGFSMKNLRQVGGVVYADFKVNDYTISQNTTLQKGIWHIENNIVVPSGITLSIAAGAELRLAPGKSFTVYGRLIAQGTSANRIKLTSSGPTSTWSGLMLSGSGANNSVISYVDIERVQTYGGSAVNVYNATGLTFTNNTISNCLNYSTTGLYLTNAGSPEIANSTISGCGGYGVTFWRLSRSLLAFLMATLIPGSSPTLRWVV